MLRTFIHLILRNSNSSDVCLYNAGDVCACVLILALLGDMSLISIVITSVYNYVNGGWHLLQSHYVNKDLVIHFQGDV